jgi:hypothetical protein
MFKEPIHSFMKCMYIVWDHVRLNHECITSNILPYEKLKQEILFQVVYGWSNDMPSYNISSIVSTST